MPVIVVFAHKSILKKNKEIILSAVMIHELNNKLLRKLMVTQDAWEYVYFDKDAYFPISDGDLVIQTI